MKVKTLWKVHAWLGLYIGTFMLLLSITGTAIVFKYEINALLNPDIYQVSDSKDQKVSLDRVAEHVLLSYPKYSLYHFKFHNSESPIEVKLKPEGSNKKSEKKKDLDVFVDPYSGKINGHRHPDTGLMQTITKLHTNLLAGKVGRYLIGTIGIAFFLMLLTGVLIYASFMKKKRFSEIRWKQGLRKISADWHKLLGITTIAFNFIWAITGITLSFLPGILEATVGKPHETFAKPKPLAKPVKIIPFTYQHIQEVVHSLYPEAEIKNIREPNQETKLMEVKLDFRSPFLKDDAAKVYIDKNKQELISHFDPRAASLGAQLFFSQDNLHYGTFAGVWTRVLYVIFGISSAILFITGFIIYYKREQKKTKPVALAKPRVGKLQPVNIH